MPHVRCSGLGARRLMGVLAGLAALLLVVAACGQKPGARDQVALEDGSVAEGEGAEVEPVEEAGEEPGEPVEPVDPADEPADADQAVEPGAAGDDGESAAQPGGDPPAEDVEADEAQPADAADDPQADPTGGGTGGTGGTGDAGGTGDTGDTEGGEGEQQPQVRGSDRTGVTDDTVRLAAHAPVTGAAPLPAPAFEEASDLFYRWYTEVQGNELLGGREVEVTFANDQYQPSTAAQVCRQLVQNHFMLFGAGGTDQIQTCGRIAERANAPYFSAGVTEEGLRGLDWYFAFSMSYRQQGRLLAEYVDREYGDQTVAAVITDTANFDDAVEGWEAGVAEQGFDYHGTLRHPRGDSGWYTSFARQLREAGVDVVYVLVAPVDYIRFAQQGREQGFDPQFVGVGITEALNPVLHSGCPHVDNGEFFSPFPGLDWVRDNDPEFFEAADHFGVEANDIAYAIWAQAKQVVELFEQYEARFGPDLTREQFRAFTAQATVDSGVFPPVSYSPDDRFGASSTHQLRADCSIEEHVTIETFVSSF